MARRSRYHRIFVEAYWYFQEELKLGEHLSSREILRLVHELVRESLNDDLDASFREPADRPEYYSRPVDYIMKQSPFEVMANESKLHFDGFGDEGYTQKGFRPKFTKIARGKL